MINPGMIAIGTTLTELVYKDVSKNVNTRIESFKNVKEITKVNSNYQEIINELLADRMELIRVAQTYKSELERIEISDEDIEYLNKTIKQMSQLVKTFVTLSEDEIKNLDLLIDLISVSTLKTMQLLGFNYKEAIGEPLTNICANQITNIGKTKKNNHNNGKGNK